MTSHRFDLCIVGAGPAGSTLALNLAASGIRIAIFDKEQFPREIVCGDALSGQVTNVLSRMPDGIYSDFLQHVEKTPSWGIRFYSPYNEPLDLPFIVSPVDNQNPPGYICSRREFDNFLFQRLKTCPNITVFEAERVEAVKRLAQKMVIYSPQRTIASELVAGADGLHSVVRAGLSRRTLDKGYYCMAIRTYFTGISGFHPQNYIELIFLKELLPAYFWIFPEVGGKANVGLGMPYKDLVARRFSLYQVMQELISTHPVIAPRFRNARMATKPQARGLALSRDLKQVSGDRYLLLGDAALLVDPFTGEGVGQAMASAESAATVILECFRSGDFSAPALAAYDQRIQRRMGMEHATSAALQRFARHPWLFNLVVHKANKNKTLKELLASAFNQDEIRKKLANPLFYARFLVG